MRHYTEEPRYSIRTLQALYNGATHGDPATQGTVRLLIEGADFPTEASVLSVGLNDLSVLSDDGTVKSGIKLTRILHAEVV